MVLPKKKAVTAAAGEDVEGTAAHARGLSLRAYSNEICVEFFAEDWGAAGAAEPPIDQLLADMAVTEVPRQWSGSSSSVDSAEEADLTLEPEPGSAVKATSTFELGGAPGAPAPMRRGSGKESPRGLRE